MSATWRVIEPASDASVLLLRSELTRTGVGVGVGAPGGSGVGDATTAPCEAPPPPPPPPPQLLTSTTSAAASPQPISLKWRSILMSPRAVMLGFTTDPLRRQLLWCSGRSLRTSRGNLFG